MSPLMVKDNFAICLKTDETEGNTRSDVNMQAKMKKLQWAALSDWLTACSMTRYKLPGGLCTLNITTLKLPATHFTIVLIGVII